MQEVFKHHGLPNEIIIDLPSSKGYDAILTMVDHFKKTAHFLPCIKPLTSKETTNLVM